MKKTSILILLALLPAAGCLAQDGILPRPPKPPGSANELTRLIHDTRVGEACYSKNLVVHPLFTSGRSPRGYCTMEEALRRKLLRILEKGEGTVPELLVENLSDEPILLLAGEIVTGGKQNRVISQDLLLAPRSGPISLGVFCVEHGRWAGQTPYFGAERELAHPKLRQQLNDPANNQTKVWAEVARKADAVGAAAPSPTGYLGAIYEDKGVQRNIVEFTKPIALPAGANGMAVVIGGRVVGVEIFGDGATFEKLRDKLLRSYAVDAIECAGRGKPGSSRETVEEFLRRVETVRLTPKQSVGIGRLLGIEGTGFYGSVLLWHEQPGAHGVVHASLFAEPPAIDRPAITPAPRPLRRE